MRLSGNEASHPCADQCVDPYAGTCADCFEEKVCKCGNEVYYFKGQLLIFFCLFVKNSKNIIF